MINEEIIQLNKFANIHNNYDIVFCKTDFLKMCFDNISQKNQNVILITGNSDYGITDQIAGMAPKNIVAWYAQNCLTNSDRVHPIPMGIENKLPCLLNGHGVGYTERVKEKEMLLCRNLTVEPKKFIYSNFSIKTNTNYRSRIQAICSSADHIDWQDSTLTLEAFFDKILEYKIVVCPIGNGVDTHRLWEVLYSNRIPLTIKVGNYKIYELYEKLPIIILDNEQDLNNIELIERKYNEQLDKKLELASYSYWEKLILEQAKTIN